MIRLLENLWYWFVLFAIWRVFLWFCPLIQPWGEFHWRNLFFALILVCLTVISVAYRWLRS